MIGSLGLRHYQVQGMLGVRGSGVRNGVVRVVSCNVPCHSLEP